MHVSTEGSDSDGMGTESSPFKTIQAGINLANVGGTVMVAEGTYQENVIVRGSNLTVIGSGWANTILDANENGSGVYAYTPLPFSFASKMVLAQPEPITVRLLPLTITFSW